MIKEKRGQNTKPLLLKSGAAVVFSVGGILFTYLRSIKTNPSESFSPQSQPSLDNVEHTDSGGDIDDKHVLYDSSSVEPDKHAESPLLKSPTSCLGNNFSPCARLNGEKDGHLLPECNEIVTDGNRNDQEICSLRNMVTTLKERERNLEIQLLKFYGLQEQETTVMELQNRLKINNMEAKLFNVRIESLESDKRRLEEQVADQAKVSATLEDAKAKIRLLKKKLRTDAEQYREQILALQERVVNLQEDEQEIVAAKQLDIQKNLQTIKVLEEETEGLKKSNDSLRLENSELTQKLDYVHLIATTVLDDDEKTAVREECQRLKQEKEDLLKDIERLQAEHRADIEELVYLRWLNACYRPKSRNQKTLQGEQVARELNTTISPESEEKSTSDQQCSCVTDSGEDSSSVDLSSGEKTHSIRKFMRLLTGKSHNNRNPRSSGSPRSRSTSEETSAYIEDMMGGYPGCSPGSHLGVSTNDFGADGMYDSSRCSSRGSRLSS